MALVNTPLPKVNRAVKPACLITGPVLRFTMEQILVLMYAWEKHHAFNARRVVRELMAKTATNARPGHIMQISAVLVKLAQRANIKRSLAKVRVSFVREENIGIKLEALYHAQTARQVDFRTPQAQRDVIFVKAGSTNLRKERHCVIDVAQLHIPLPDQ